MSFDDKFSTRVAHARAIVGLTQTELAKLSGVVQRQIAAYEGGEAKPREKTLMKMAAALGTSVEWLTSGNGNPPNTRSYAPYTSVRQIPKIEMGNFADRFEEEIQNAEKFHPCWIDIGANSFAMIIRGYSMSGSGGYSFPEGAIVTFDPSVEPSEGSFVLYAIEDEMTFKQYFPDMRQITLKSLNKDYADIVIKKGVGRVIATAVHAEIRLPH